MKCKECGKRIPHSHKDEAQMNGNICRKCHAIKTSKYKHLSNKEEE